MNVFDRARRLAHARRFVHLDTSHHERTLVIVDMQTEYVTDWIFASGIIGRIRVLIENAIKNKWAIIILEFDGSGATVDEILEAIGDYPHQSTVSKEECDGGKEVIKCIESHTSWSLNTLVCGVFGDECVSQTVAGMFDASNLVEIDVVVDAVHPPYMSSSEPDQHDQTKEGMVTTEGLGIVENCQRSL